MLPQQLSTPLYRSLPAALPALCLLWLNACAEGAAPLEPVGSVTFEPDTAVIAAGVSLPVSQPTLDHRATATAPILVVRRDGSGNVIPDAAITLVSLDESIVRVNPNGMVEAIAPGVGRIEASVSGASDKLVVRVVPPYELIFLGTMGHFESHAFDVNAKRQVVGEACTGTQCVPFIWENGSMTALEGTGSAFAINDDGVIVGRDSGSGAVMWKDGSRIALEVPADGYRPVVGAYDISPDGVVVGGWRGTMCTRGCRNGGFLWHEGEVVPLDFQARAINAEGVVVGLQLNYDRIPRAMTWKDGLTEPVGGFASEAHDLNEQGEIVGYTTEGGGSPAYRWETGERGPLGTLRGQNLARAYGINSSGRIVGASGGVGTFAMNFPLGWIWADDMMADLNHLIIGDGLAVVEEGRAINDRGDIAGTARRGRREAVLLLREP